MFGHSSSVCSLVQLADGKLASGSDDKTIKIWGVEQGWCFKTLAGHSSCVYSLVQLADGKLASGSDDKTIKIWDVEQGQCLKTLAGHSGYVFSLIRLADGKLASGSYDDTIKIWDVEQGQCLKRLAGHSNSVSSLVQLADGKLASGSDDKTIKIWEAPVLTLTITQIEQLMDALRQNPDVHTLILTQETLIQAHYIQLCQLISLHPRLNTIDLRGCKGPWREDKGKQLVEALQTRTQPIMVWVDPEARLLPDLKHGYIRPSSSLHYTGLILSVTKSSLAISSQDATVKRRYQLKDQSSLTKELAILGIENAEACAHELREAFKKQSWHTPTSAQISPMQILFNKYPVQATVGLFAKIMEEPEQLDIHVINLMFEHVTGLALFRLPYTLANIAYKLGQFDKTQLNKIVYNGLRLIAEKHMVDSQCIAIYKLLLRDAFHKGLITRTQKYELDNIAENTKIFNDPRFVTLQKQTDDETGCRRSPR